jgi:hypothetical protein
LAARLEFQFVGAGDARFDQVLANHPLAPSIRRRQHVPKREALSMMKASAALLIVGDERLSIYIPGKLYDYLASRRPVLFYGAEEKLLYSPRSSGGLGSRAVPNVRSSLG